MTTPHATTAGEPALIARHLTKRYGHHTVVDDVGFRVPAGQVTGLLGPNGAGKTTIMKMLVGLARPDGGDVSLPASTPNSTPTPASTPTLAPTRIGTMIEEPSVYRGMTARQNLVYRSLAVTGGADTDELDGLLRLVGLDDRADDRARSFSTGMKQRLGIALSLVGHPSVVILDEPTSGLDPIWIRSVRSLLRGLADQGVAVLVSSHQLAEIEQACDRLVVLDRGRLLAAGTVAEVRGSAPTLEDAFVSLVVPS